MSSDDTRSVGSEDVSSSLPDDSPPADDPPLDGVGAAARHWFEVERIRVLFNVRRDVDALRTLPGGPWSVLGPVVIVTIAIALFRLGIRDVYTESVLFLVLAIALGLFGWTVGIVLVTLYALFDLVVFVAEPGWVQGWPWPAVRDVTLATLSGRFVAYALLYALVVSIPAIQRSAHVRVESLVESSRRFTSVGEGRGEYAAAVASAVLVGGLVYLWTVITPYLIRATFRPTAMTTRFSPTVDAIAPLQEGGVLIAVLAGVAALAVAIGYQHQAGIVRALPRPRRTNDLTLVTARRLVQYAILIVLISGIVTHVLDVLVLVIAFVAAELLVRAFATVQPLQQLGARLSREVRFLVSIAVVLLVTGFVMETYYRPQDRPDLFVNSEFFPFVLSIAVGVFVVRVLVGLGDHTAPTREGNVREPRRRALRPAFVFVGVGLFVATVPDMALAHDCSGLSDCEAVGRGMLAAAAAALAAALAFYPTVGEGGVEGEAPEQPPPEDDEPIEDSCEL